MPLLFFINQIINNISEFYSKTIYYLYQIVYPCLILLEKNILINPLYKNNIYFKVTKMQKSLLQYNNTLK